MSKLELDALAGIVCLVGFSWFSSLATMVIIGLLSKWLIPWLMISVTVFMVSLALLVIETKRKN